jgi:hypothetical protein
LSNEDFTNDETEEDLGPSATEPSTDDAISSRGRIRKERRIDKERRESRDFWIGVLNSPVGRKELWGIVCGSLGAHAFETRFPSGPAGVPDPNAAWYARGEQDFGLRLYQQWLSLDVFAVKKMHDENDPRFAPAKMPPKR